MCVINKNLSKDTLATICVPTGRIDAFPEKLVRLVAFLRLVCTNDEYLVCLGKVLNKLFYSRIIIHEPSLFSNTHTHTHTQSSGVAHLCVPLILSEIAAGNIKSKQQLKAASVSAKCLAKQIHTAR